MSGRNRIVLGRTADVRDGAVHTASPWRDAFAAHDWSKMARAAVERVRRQFGNRYARIASAYFRRKRWEAAKVPRRTFFHALKKSKIFYRPINIGRKRCREGRASESRCTKSPFCTL